ncbi:hypothetical protein HF633_12945, partial [Weissella cibaria]|nr:hypothetical protein [Weissella cibaria]
DIIREMPSTESGIAPYAIPNKFKFDARGAGDSGTPGAFLQDFFGSLMGFTVLNNFDGQSDDDNAAVLGFRVVPPDTQGDVGPDHYLQHINLIAEIFDKNGNTLLGPFAGNAFWQGLGGDCQNRNDGDPITIYDYVADRWMVSQFDAASP